MLRYSILLFAFSLFSITAYNQNGAFDLGVEFQAYPTGLIPGIHLELGISEKDAIQGRVGYNIVRHRDLGVQDDETGGGFGFTLGYRRYFKPQRSGIFIGARSDLWFNEVDWIANIDSPDEIRGTSNVTVLQPTAELGYVVHIGEKGVFFSPNIALGAEININTDGAEIGQGAILLLGFSFGKRF